MATRRQFLLVGAAGPALANAPAHPWEKKGLILAPGFAGTRSTSLLSAPCAVRLKNGNLRLYFWTRAESRNYIYAAEAPPGDYSNWNLVRPDWVLGPSPSGNINNLGPGFPFVLRRDDGPWLMYYCSWGSWAPPDEISNRTCLAQSSDEGITWAVSHEPLLPLGEPGSFDAGVTGSVHVMRTGRKQYRMWYTAGERYAMVGSIKRALVNIGHAVSRDGIRWVKSREPVLRPRLAEVKPYEAVVSKPSILRLGGWYHLWFSVFCMEGRGYRLNYARSRDGLHWERFADREVIPLTPGGFDSVNQSYANVIESGDELWMFYSGNQFGTTGIGLATMKKARM
jgi:hypothetical protein